MSQPPAASRAGPELGQDGPKLAEPSGVPSRPKAVAPPAQSQRDTPSWRRIGVHIARGLLAVAVLWLLLVATAIVLYRWVDPPFTTLTGIARLAGKDVRQHWIGLDRIAPGLIRAVIVSEDARFCQHFGVSIDEIEKAIERSRDGIPRGASTISMQVTKNLFLWPQRSYVRKAVEIPLTLLLEVVLPKRRILEIYLNVAEWGPGVFGIEAAARHHFRKSATRLTEAESALLAVTLPNPRARNPARPSAGVQRLASGIEARKRANPRAAHCILDRATE